VPLPPDLRPSKEVILQGQRTLSRFAEEDFEKEVVVPSAASSLHGDALLTGVLLEQ
jgi:hypothetical protein